MREGFISAYAEKEDSAYSYVVNPLTWQLEGLGEKKLARGAVLKKFNKVYKGVCEARVAGNVLWVSRPRFPWSFLVRKMKDYHVADINLFYVNIRENLKLRLGRYLNKMAKGEE
jgi:hypothetical protein